MYRVVFLFITKTPFWFASFFILLFIAFIPTSTFPFSCPSFFFSSLPYSLFLSTSYFTSLHSLFPLSPYLYSSLFSSFGSDHFTLPIYTCQSAVYFNMLPLFFFFFLLYYMIFIPLIFPPLSYSISYCLTLSTLFLSSSYTMT